MFGQEGEGGTGYEPGCNGQEGRGRVGAYMVAWERGTGMKVSMYMNICVCSSTCVSMCLPVYLSVCICMDSRQDDWRAVCSCVCVGRGVQE